MKTFILREKTRWMFEFLAKPFIMLKMPPSWISFISLLMIFAACFALYEKSFYLAALFVLLNGVLDALDGVVARKTDKASALGNLTDNVIDKLSDAVILAAFIVLGLVDLNLGLFALVMMFMANNVVVNIEAIFHIKVGQAISTRFLRILFLVALIPFQEFELMYWMIAVLSTYTFFERLVKIILYVKKDIKIV